jgi:hypothetical protein
VQTIVIVTTILILRDEIILVFIILNYTVPRCASLLCRDPRWVERVFIIIGRLGIANGFLLGLEITF